MSFEILAVVGPTASGKSNLAIEIAKSLATDGKEVEIINADAMQLYQGMDIGTAKLTEDERFGIPHHLIDVVEPNVEVTAVEYKKLAREKILEIQNRNHLPLLVGGSMFYIAAVLDELEFAPTDIAVRSAIEQRQRDIGPLALHQELAQLDAVTAAKIPANNLRRVVRALEVIELTGQKYSSSLPEPKYWKPTLQLGIEISRDELRQRVIARCQKMWRDSILEEASALKRSGVLLGRTARMAIGYSQAYRQLAGEISEAEAIAETVSLTMRYARRQMSWFRRDKRIHWMQTGPGLLDQALRQIRLEQ